MVETNSPTVVGITTKTRSKPHTRLNSEMLWESFPKTGEFSTTPTLQHNRVMVHSDELFDLSETMNFNIGSGSTTTQPTVGLSAAHYLKLAHD